MGSPCLLPQAAGLLVLRVSRWRLQHPVDVSRTGRKGMEKSDECGLFLRKEKRKKLSETPHGSPAEVSFARPVPASPGWSRDWKEGTWQRGQRWWWWAQAKPGSCQEADVMSREVAGPLPRWFWRLVSDPH